MCFLTLLFESHRNTKSAFEVKQNPDSHALVQNFASEFKNVWFTNKM